MNSRTPEYRKAYAAAHYLSHKDAYLARNRRYKGTITDLYRSLKSAPCTDCKGIFPHFVMDFDHRDQTTKIGIVSRMRNASQLKLMLAEIKKCDIVCANCHRIRTYRQYSAKQVPRKLAN